VDMGLSTEAQPGPQRTLQAASPGRSSAPASSPRSAHLLMPWGRWIAWTLQASRGPHKCHVELTGIVWTSQVLWPHRRGVMEGAPPAWHRAVPWAPSEAGCPCSRVASAAQNTLPVQAIPPRSRIWHGGGCHLRPDVDGISWGTLTHLSRLEPFPRSTELLSSTGCWEPGWGNTARQQPAPALAVP